MTSVVSISSKANAGLYVAQSFCMNEVAVDTTSSTGVQHLPTIWALCIAFRGVLCAVRTTQLDYFCAGFQQKDAVHPEETCAYTAVCDNLFMLPVQICKFF